MEVHALLNQYTEFLEQKLTEEIDASDIVKEISRDTGWRYMMHEALKGKQFEYENVRFAKNLLLELYKMQKSNRSSIASRFSKMNEIVQPEFFLREKKINDVKNDLKRQIAILTVQPVADALLSELWKEDYGLTEEIAAECERKGIKIKRHLAEQILDYHVRTHGALGIHGR